MAKNTNELINKLLKQVENADLGELEHAFLYEKNPVKQNVLHALYTYALDKKQEEIIKQDFII